MSEKELKDLIKGFIYCNIINEYQIQKTFNTTLSQAINLMNLLELCGYFIESSLSKKQFNLSFYKEIEKLIIDELFVLKLTI